MNRAETIENAPQGLKPASFRNCFGTTEVVPFQNSICNQFWSILLDLRRG
jgi:hypothetical protein